MKKEWSITEQEKGAKTIEEISEKSKLGKRNKNQHKCSHVPLFSFIPIERVVDDTLHTVNNKSLLVRKLLWFSWISVNCKSFSINFCSTES